MALRSPRTQAVRLASAAPEVASDGNPRRLPRRRRRLRLGISRRTAVVAALLVVACVAGIIGWKFYTKATSTQVTAYFENTNGLYAGDDVKLMGVTVGKIGSISADGDKMKVVFRIQDQKVPAGASRRSSCRRRWCPRASFSSRPVTAADPPSPTVRSSPSTAPPFRWNGTISAISSNPEHRNRYRRRRCPRTARRLHLLGREHFDGKGTDINRTLTELSKAAQTLGDGRSDMFATIRNLKVFASALSPAATRWPSSTAIWRR